MNALERMPGTRAWRNALLAAIRRHPLSVAEDTLRAATPRTRDASTFDQSHDVRTAQRGVILRAARRMTADPERQHTRLSTSPDASGRQALCSSNHGTLSGQRNAASPGPVRQALINQDGRQDSRQHAAQVATEATDDQRATTELQARQSANVRLEHCLNAGPRTQNNEQQPRLTKPARQHDPAQYKRGSHAALDLRQTEPDIFAIRRDGIHARHDRWQAIVAVLVACGPSRTTWAMDQAQV